MQYKFSKGLIMKELSVTVDFGDRKIDIGVTDITRMFHMCYYNSRIWENTFWHGHQILKCPMDMWIYQELIWKIKPDYIIETGTFRGGSALYYSHLFDLQGQGEVITIDVMERPNRPEHDRIHYLIGSSSDAEIFSQVQSMIGENKKVMVVLDSDHSRDHVFKEMQLWHSMVSQNSYMIVEDSNVNGYPVRPDFGPGPMEAINDFLQINNMFEIDKSQEKFLITQNPRGYLKKLS
jgi:cephalosporin hydroxylase